MMKITVIGILYNLLLQSIAAAEPMVKTQMCSDFFANGITESLNKIASSELEDDIGDFEIRRYSGKAWFGRWETYVIPITSVQFKNSKRCEILSNDHCETIFDAIIVYGEKSYNQNRRKNSNSYLFLKVRIMGTLYFKIKGEKFIFRFENCQVFLRQSEDNESKNFAPDSKAMNTLGKRICNIINKIIDILNKNWKDSFIIDPSGDAKLLFKSVVQSSPDCVEFNFNLNVSNSEVSSEQRHESLPGNGISLAKNYITAIFPNEGNKRELNRQLEITQLQISPDELRLLLPDVFEKDKTVVKSNVEELTINAENELMTLLTTLEGFSTKSDKSSFQVKFNATVKMEFALNTPRVMLQFRSTGDQDVLSWKSNIGKSGEPDYKNLHAFTEKFVSETLVAALKNLNLSFKILYWNLPSTLSVKPQSFQILM